MKLATWNINSIRARKDRLLAWLSEHGPDVVCLQETKVTDEVFPMDELEELGYCCAIHGQRAYNGVAIVSRTEITDVRRGFGDGGDDAQARCIAGTIAGVRVIDVYVPNGKAPGTEKYAYKLEWLRRLRRYLDASAKPGEPVILCGDFNVAPDDRDVHDPAVWEGEIMCSVPERRGLQEVVDFGFEDALRLRTEEGGIFTWWDYRMLAFPKNRGLRIDHIFVTAPMAARLESVVVDRQARKGKLPSDHAPVVATFRDEVP